jgi:hypothetical protein
MHTMCRCICCNNFYSFSHLKMWKQVWTHITKIRASYDVAWVEANHMIVADERLATSHIQRRNNGLINTPIPFFLEIGSLAPAFFGGSVRDAGVAPLPGAWLACRLATGSLPSPHQYHIMLVLLLCMVIPWLI